MRAPSVFVRSVLVAAALAAASRAEAADAYSPVYGFLKFDCSAASDTVVSVPFHPVPRWAGRLSGIPLPEGTDRVRLALANSPSFAANELTTRPHFLLVRDTSGPTGRHFDIVAHSTNHIDIAAEVADLDGLLSNGLVSVIPAWTLDSLFPPASQTTFHPSTGPLASKRGSELLFFDNTTAGTSLAPSRRFYVTSSGWFEVGSYAPADNVALSPGQAFLVRHPEVADATEFIPHQQVYGGPVTLPVRTDAGKAVDTMLALPRPVPITLADIGAGGPVEESATTASNDRKDQLLVYDNSAAGLNKQPTTTYFRVGGEWRKDDEGDGFPVSDAVSIEPSAGLLLRKAAGGTGGVLHWTHAPTYDVTAP